MAARSMGGEYVSLGTERLDVVKEIDFSWKLYSLKDFLKQCSHKMPMLMIVREGYSGSSWSGLEEISQQEVYWVTKKGVTEPRVIAKEGGRHTSLPLDESVSSLSVTLQGSQGKHTSKTLRLGDVVKSERLPVTVRVKGQHQLKVLLGSDQPMVPFQTLQIIEVYQYQYLLGYPVPKNRIFTSRPRVIPVYVPIRVSPAQEKGRLYTEITRRIMTECRLSQLAPQLLLPFSNDIMVYSEEEVSKNRGIYDSITPEQVYSISLKRQSIGRESKRVQLDLTDGDSSTDGYLAAPTKSRDSLHIYESIKEVTPVPDVATALPDDISELSISELSDCLRELNMGEYAPGFVKCQIDGALLQMMDATDLKEQFNMNQFSAKKLCLFAKGEWRPKTSSTTKM